MTNNRSALEEVVVQSRAIGEAVASGSLSLIVPSAVTGDSHIDDLRPDRQALDYIIQTPGELERQFKY